MITLKMCSVKKKFVLFILCIVSLGGKNSLTLTPESSINISEENTLASFNIDESKDTVHLNIPYYPLRSEDDLDILLKEIGDARVVLLGEASHGTSEYYRWRSSISKRLIKEKGFNFIAVEGEWADSYRVNDFIKEKKQDSTAVIALLKNYNRWPTWMWGNYEVTSLVSWLNAYNQNKQDSSKVGFFGLDVYCL